METIELDKIERHEGPLEGASNLFMNRIEIAKHNLRREVASWKRRLRHPRTWGLLAAAILGFLALVAGVTYIAFAAELASKERIVNAKNTGTILYDRNGKLLYATEGAHDVTYVNFSDIGQNIKDATVAVEDKDFYAHGGFSFQAILRSIYANFLNADPTKYGGSTITQQLVKNALLTPHKNFLRKFQEFVLSVEIERRYSKDEILEMYLNSVYYGSGAYGIGNASKVYFAKTPADLNVPEAAQLAALPVAPSLLSPLTGDRAAAKLRQELVIGRMVENNYLSKEEGDAAKGVTLKFTPLKVTLGASPHFSLYVLGELREKYGEDYVGRSGLRVTTSLDLDLQLAAEKVARDRIAALTRNKASNAGVVVIDPKTGQVLAMVGSVDYEKDEIGGKVNVTFADRQPGSAIKPLIYMKAFETRNYTAATVLSDVRRDFGGGYRPENADLKYRGDILARFALANSLNVPAVEMLDNIGIDSALEMIHRLKVSTLRDRERYGLSLVLGGGEMKLFELTRSYGVIANYGNFVETTPVLKIIDRGGNQVFVANPRKENLVDPQFTYIVSHILSDNSARSMVFGNLLNASRKAAVKTGTTENFRDAWSVGFTPNLVVGVWVGNNDGSFMDSVAGSLGAAPIWRQVMEAGWKIFGWEDFREPAGIQKAVICRGDGLLSRGGEGSYQEIFALGTVPTQRCGADLKREEEEKLEEERKKEEERAREATMSGTPVATDSGTLIP